MKNNNINIDIGNRSPIKKIKIFLIKLLAGKSQVILNCGIDVTKSDYLVSVCDSRNDVLDLIINNSSFGGEFLPEGYSLNIGTREMVDNPRIDKDFESVLDGAFIINP